EGSCGQRSVVTARALSACRGQLAFDSGSRGTRRARRGASGSHRARADVARRRGPGERGSGLPVGEQATLLEHGFVDARVGEVEIVTLSRQDARQGNRRVDATRSEALRKPFSSTEGGASEPVLVAPEVRPGRQLRSMYLLRSERAQTLGDATQKWRRASPPSSFFRPDSPLRRGRRSLQ